MALDQSESKMLSTWLNVWRSWFWGPTSQSGIELRIQDSGAHESQPCWKPAHQAERRTGIGLAGFHGDTCTNHVRVSQKCLATLKSTWLNLGHGYFWGRKSQSGVELRIQDRYQQWNLETRLQVSIRVVFGWKIANWTQRYETGLADFHGESS